jgi:predicted amidohydrolase
MDTASSFQVAVIQHAPVFLNLDASVDKANALIEETAGQGAQVIVFPETWLPGYPVWLDYAPKAALWDHGPAKALFRILAANSITVPGEHLGKLLAAAGRTGTYIVMGAHELLGGTLYNTMLFLNRDGERFGLHRKLVPTYTERLVWGRGDGSTLHVMPTEYGPLGGLICWEHWMPLARAAMHAKLEVLHVAQWPWVRDLHQLASRHYAFEGQCFVAAAGCVLTRTEIIEGVKSLGPGEEQALELLGSGLDGKEMVLRGGSAVIAPHTGYVAGPLYDEPGILYAEVQPQRIVEGRMALDTQGHYARPDVFRLEVDDEPQENVTFRSRRG